ncbi:MAG: potassium channel family protein [Gammaproteobacteria bacterium]|nr:potassium channel family protein [Gammaproteobacteria bacterium]
MSSQLLIGTVLIVVNAVFHVSCLVWLAGVINYVGTSWNLAPNRRRLILLLGIAVLGLIAIHTTSAWAWALVYVAVGEFSELRHALYFSVVTSTTLGYGDITLSERWRLLASFEAMGGLVLFGASTAFLMAAIKSWFSHLEKPTG